MIGCELDRQHTRRLSGRLVQEGAADDEHE